MKLAKSILRPIRRATRNGSFFSRRLRKPSSGKKRSGGFENPEPSSPKVTCIGQVRVKSKRKVKQCRSLSKRRIGEISFRNIEKSQQSDEDKVCSRAAQRYSNGSAHYQQERLPHRNQRWVHLPISVCHALRAFGAEFSCLFPCTTSSFSRSKRDKAEIRGCGRWLVWVNVGGGGKRKEIEMVVGGGEEEKMSIKSSTRHVFEDIEVNDERNEMKEEEEEASRPPENALLLMRCRSDPMQMAARLSWDAHVAADHANQSIEEQDFEGLGKDKEKILLVKEDETDQVFEQVPTETDEEEKIQNEAEAKMETEVGDDDSEKEEVESNMSSFEALLVQENTEQQEIPTCHLPSPEKSIERLPQETATDKGKEDEEEADTEESTTSDKDTTMTGTHKEDEREEQKATVPTELEAAGNEESMKEKQIRPALPECLLLMMYEPKLSMEVSKETWVCSTDFVRRIPERQRKPAKATTNSCCHHNAVKRRHIIPTKPKYTVPNKKDQQPARSSCSLPAASMASVIEVNELTRCKSEPRRTAPAKLTPESCFWNNASMKLETHSHTGATLGIGAAGVGF